MVDSTVLDYYNKFRGKVGGLVGFDAASSLQLARAHAALDEALERGEARVRWEPDEDVDLDWMDVKQLRAFRSGILEARVLTVERIKDGKPIDDRSLFGIVSTFDASDEYPTQLEAEMALELGFGRVPSVQLKFDRLLPF